MKSNIALNTSPLTLLMKNTGCEHGFFYFQIKTKCLRNTFDCNKKENHCAQIYLKYFSEVWTTCKENQFMSAELFSIA